MKENNNLQKDVQGAITSKSLMNAAEPGVKGKTGRNFKRLIYLTSLAGMGLFLHGCMAGYVATEPTYVEFSRPARPNNNYIWVNGGWSYNRSNHVYVQKNGNWQKPNQNRNYVQGHWQASPKGKYWVAGRYEKQGQGNKHNR